MKKVKMIEYYWENDRGCHYSLTPEKENENLISQYWIDSKSLIGARRKANKWIDTMQNELQIIIEVVKK